MPTDFCSFYKSFIYVQKELRKKKKSSTLRYLTVQMTSSYKAWTAAWHDGGYKKRRPTEATRVLTDTLGSATLPQLEDV